MTPDTKKPRTQEGVGEQPRRDHGVARSGSWSMLRKDADLRLSFFASQSFLNSWSFDHQLPTTTTPLHARHLHAPVCSLLDNRMGGSKRFRRAQQSILKTTAQCNGLLSISIRFISFHFLFLFTSYFEVLSSRSRWRRRKCTTEIEDDAPSSRSLRPTFFHSLRSGYTWVQDIIAVDWHA